MRKILIFLNVLVAFVVLFSACDNSKTYAERLDEEKAAISKLISDSFIVIPFNKDSLYTPKNKHIMQLSNGVYVGIISKGNRSDTAVTGTTVTFRFKGARVVGDTLTYQNIQSIYPCEFVYKKTSATSFYYTGVVSCEGVQKPLAFLGNGATVKLIIPSKMNFSDYQDISVVKPMYFQELTYKFSVR